MFSMPSPPICGGYRFTFTLNSSNVILWNI
jgi:hypothetical protein